MEGNSIKCPVCNVGLIDLSSMNMRVCGCCHREYEWKLKPGQKSVLIKGVIGYENNSRRNEIQKIN